MAPMDTIQLYSVLIYVALACHFMAPHHPTSSTPTGVLVVLATSNYLKWQAIQLIIHSTFGV